MINFDQKTENKLLAKQEFLELDKLLNKFNVFEATDMVTREVKHTKFLSYLLNPNESHGLGEVFIRNFIIRVSNQFENFPRFFDLDLSFTEVFAEHKVGNKKLDCLIKIPLRNTSPESQPIIIAIENKLNAKQGVEQLKVYREDINKDFSQRENFFIFLTFNYEEPNDEKWKHITYQDVVLPSVKATLDMLEDTGSPHLKAILNDYYELLISDAEVDKEKDDLAAHLMNEFGTYIKSLKNHIKTPKSERTQCQIYIKHKKTIKYLTRFDNDPRSPILKWWKALNKVPKHDENEDVYELIIESSIRSHLRFSLLSKSNRDHLISLSRNSRKWLESGCPLAFEIVVYVQDKLFNCRLLLVLGPIDSMEERVNLLGKLAPNKSVGGLWTSIPFEKFIDTPKERTTKPESWIENNIFEVNTSSSQIKPRENILKIATEINAKLKAYFAERATPSDS